VVLLSKSWFGGGTAPAAAADGQATKAIAITRAALAGARRTDLLLSPGYRGRA
jgi:stage V sporulation protein SpoVS